jgi:hypothetical protein
VGRNKYLKSNMNIQIFQIVFNTEKQATEGKSQKIRRGRRKGGHP